MSDTPATMPDAAPEQFPRPFLLRRTTDHTGVSGIGTVATGAQFPDGTVVLRWRGPHASTVIWGSLDDALAVHGHDGATVPVFADPAVTTVQRYTRMLDTARATLGELPLARPWVAEDPPRRPTVAPAGPTEQQLAALRTELHDTRLRRDDARAGRTDAERELARAEQRLATAAQLADALGDYPIGDAWTLAAAIRRLCAGEITPEQALADTADD
ncbi:hypothetical protein ACFC1B_26980 [Streptomyces xiamenensis]|uniref:hypothetical protein n=1 Tax=Streptomyces xiamenensis TaxID=408015 RepID=UPI0035D6C1F7